MLFSGDLGFIRHPRILLAGDLGFIVIPAFC